MTDQNSTARTGDTRAQELFQLRKAWAHGEEPAGQDGDAVYRDSLEKEIVSLLKASGVNAFTEIHDVRLPGLGATP
jgi:hypothetical protein